MDLDLDFIFSLHFQRTVHKDGTFSFEGNKYKIGHMGQGQFLSPGEEITVACIPNKKLMAYKDGQKIFQYHLVYLKAIDKPKIHIYSIGNKNQTSTNREKSQIESGLIMLFSYVRFFVPGRPILKVA